MALRKTPQEKLLPKDYEKDNIAKSPSFCLDLRNIFSTSSKIPRRVPQRRKIYQTPPGKNFNIDIELQTCIHGYLSPTKREAASLLIFRVQAVSLGKKGTVNRMLMQVEFDESPSSPSADIPSRPTIISHAPFFVEEAQKLTEARIHRSNSEESSGFIDIELAGGKAGIKKVIKEVTSRNAVQKFFGKGASATFNNKSGRTSGVWWNVKKSNDPDAKDDAGIESNHRFAILLSRSSKACFRAKLNLLVDAGWRYRAENGLSQRTKIQGESSGLLFDPHTWYEGQCAGINRKRLGHFNRDERLAALTKVA